MKEYAYRQGLSMAGAIRQLLRARFGGEEGYAPERISQFMNVAGVCADKRGKRDVARNHDRYLYDGET